MKKIIIALASITVFVSCASAPSSEDSAAVIGAENDMAVSSLADEDAPSLSSADINGDAAKSADAAVEEQQEEGDAAQLIPPSEAMPFEEKVVVTEKVSANEALLPPVMLRTIDMVSSASALAGKADNKADNSEDVISAQTKESAAKNATVAAKAPRSPAANKAGDAITARDEQARALDDSDKMDEDALSTGAIAMASKTHPSEKEIALPMLPPRSIPSNEPSQVFVTEYDPSESSEAKSGQDREREDSEADSGEGKAASCGERAVVLKNGQYLDVVYPGAGWVYLGEGTNVAKKIAFKGRKLGEEDTQFTLRAQRPGQALLHFYKNDAATNNYIDDYLEVIVADEVASTIDGHVKAPAYDDAKGLLQIKQQMAMKEKAAKEARIQAEAAAKAEEQKRAEAKRQEEAAAKANENKTASKTAAKAQKDAPSVAKGAANKESAKKVSGNQGGAAKVNKKSDGAGGKQKAASKDTAKLDEKKARDSEGKSGAMGRASVAGESVQGADAAKKSALASPFGSGAEDAPSGASVSLAVPGDMNEGALLEAAQRAYNARRYADSLTLLNAFFDKATSRVDEGLYLEGLSLEAHSNVQNIKGAIDTYNILMRNYPASRLWEKARERSIYLKRMYIDIR